MYKVYYPYEGGVILRYLFQRIIIPTVFIFLLEQAFSFYLTGGIITSIERKDLILIPLLLSIVFNILVTPPEKILGLFNIPLLFSISPLCIKFWSGETVSQADIIHTIGFLVGLYSLILLVGTLISKLTLKKIYYSFAIIIFILPSLGFWFYYGMSGSIIHPDTLMTIFQTNLAESQSYLRDNITPLALLFLLIPFIGIPLIYKYSSKLTSYHLQSFKSKKAIILILILCCGVSWMIYHNRDNLYRQLYKGTHDYLHQYTTFADNKKKRENSILSSFNLTQIDEPGIYFLVIGESQNRLHMSAYGYNRDTTPWLNDQRHNSNFIIYDNAYSCHTHTVPVITYALTAKNQYNSVKLENAVSIIEVAKAAGFHTVWLSNQVQYSAWDTPITVIASEADEQHWINKNVGETTKTNYFDGELINTLSEVHPSSKTLIVIHLMGNHGSYEDRYPSAYNIYHGDNKTIDHYDDSIRYNDYVVSQLYEKAITFPNFKAFIYFSDHTDAVDQNLAHDASNFVYPMTYIPFYMAFSQEYQEEYPLIFENLKKHSSDYFTNDLIFNTVLGVMNLHLNGMYESQNDLTNSDYDNNKDRFMTLYGKKKIIDKDA